MAKAQDEFSNQQFQNQKVTNLESEEQMSKRFQMQAEQAQVLQQ